MIFSISDSQSIGLSIWPQPVSISGGSIRWSATSSGPAKRNSKLRADSWSRLVQCFIWMAPKKRNVLGTSLAICVLFVRPMWWFYHWCFWLGCVWSTPWTVSSWLGSMVKALTTCSGCLLATGVYWLTTGGFTWARGVWSYGILFIFSSSVCSRFKTQAARMFLWNYGPCPRVVPSSRLTYARSTQVIVRSC